MGEKISAGCAGLFLIFLVVVLVRFAISSPHEAFVAFAKLFLFAFLIVSNLWFFGSTVVYVGTFFQLATTGKTTMPDEFIWLWKWIAITSVSLGVIALLSRWLWVKFSMVNFVVNFVVFCFAAQRSRKSVS